MFNRKPRAILVRVASARNSSAFGSRLADWIWLQASIAFYAVVGGDG